MGWTMGLAGLAAAAWGCSDFLAGWGGRRIPVRTVLVGSRVTALVLGVGCLILVGRAADLRLLALTGLAGALTTPAMGLLYRAMRDGSMAVVAPVAAGAALVPVGWGLAHGERLGAGGVVGAVAALAGITLASWPVREEALVRRRAARWYAAGAALGFGAFFVLLHEAAGETPYVAAAYCQVFGGLVALGLAAWRRPARPRQPRAPVLLVPIAVGVLESLADGAFALAASKGALGAAAVLASLYPAVTVLLNAFVLRERLPSVHLCGVLSVLLGVACLAA